MCLQKKQENEMKRNASKNKNRKNKIKRSASKRDAGVSVGRDIHQPKFLSL